MPKLARAPQKILGSTSSNNGQFGSARAGTYLTSTDVSVLQGLPAWGAGWFDALVSGDLLPTVEERQGVDYVITRQLAYLMQEGVAEYDSATTYYIGSWVKEAGTNKLYSSLTDDNVGNALSDGAEWKLLVDFDSGFLLAANNLSDLASAATARTNLGLGAVATLSTVPVANGGTNITSYTAGDILYATGATTLAKLPKGTAFQNLRMNSGATAPEWSNPVIVDRAYAETDNYSSLGTTIPFDDTIPQNTEGTQILTVGITPKRTTNRLRITVCIHGALNAGSSNLVAALFFNSQANAIATSGTIFATSIGTMNIVYEFAAGTTSACTFNVRVGSGSGGFYINGDSVGRKYGTSLKSTIVVEEIYA